MLQIEMQKLSATERVQEAPPGSRETDFREGQAGQESVVGTYDARSWEGNGEKELTARVVAVKVSRKTGVPKLGVNERQHMKMGILKLKTKTRST